MNNINNKLNVSDTIFLIVISVVIGIIWMIYGIFFHAIHPALAALNLTGLVRGIWSISGGFFGVVLRKKYSAFLGNLLPSIVEMSFSTWGIYNLIYGVIEGVAAELLFILFGYNKASFRTMLIANLSSSTVSFIIDLFIFHLFRFSFSANLFRLVTDLTSTILFSIPVIITIKYLLKLGYLDQYAIGQAYIHKPGNVPI
jgi:energy-coupling factor transport system substrate-specific component